MPALTLVCSPCLVAASAEPQKLAVVLRPANLVVVSQPLLALAVVRLTSTSGRFPACRHHAASQPDAALLNQAAVHLPLRPVLQLAVQNAERTALQHAGLKVQTAPHHVPVPVLQLVGQRLQAVLHHVPANVHPPVVQREPTVLHHVPAPVLQPAVLRELTVLHHVPVPVALSADRTVHLPVVQKELIVPHHVRTLVLLSVDQTVLQPAVAIAAAAAITPAKLLN